jgi:hypothetical protein
MIAAIRNSTGAKITAALAGTGVAAAGLYGTRGEREILGLSREQMLGLGAGAATGYALKRAITLPTSQVADGASLLQKTRAMAPGFGMALGIGTIPSLYLLSATHDGKTVLGQGHDFWSGAVWGLAGVGTAAAVRNPKLGPYAAGWVASDFLAIGLDKAGVTPFH